MLVTSLKLVKCKTMKRAREPLLTIRSVSFAHSRLQSYRASRMERFVAVLWYPSV